MRRLSALVIPIPVPIETIAQTLALSKTLTLPVLNILYFIILFVVYVISSRTGDCNLMVCVFKGYILTNLFTIDTPDF